MKVKIVSDGTHAGTSVIDLETGKPLEGVTLLEWRVLPGALARADIVVKGVPLEVTTEADVRKEEKPT